MLDAHSICLLASDAFFALGIQDPIAWGSQASWLAEGLLDNVFTTDDTGRLQIRLPLMESLGELACLRRFDVDSACQHLLTIAAVNLFLTTASQE